MTAEAQPLFGWAVLRRMPARMVAGRPEGGYTSAFEVVCRDCGDDPCLDYRDVSAGLRRIRGPYQLIVAAAVAYEEHVALHSGCVRPQLSPSIRP